MRLLASDEWQGRIWTGEWSEGGGPLHEAVEPSTGASLGHLGQASVADVHTAANRARQAQVPWAALGYNQRAAILRRAAEAFAASREELVGWLAKESGAVSSIGDVQVTGAVAECHEAAGLASHPNGDLLRTAQPRLSFSRRNPAGVVVVIAPFNAPLILAIRAVAPALALGNAVILKPDVRTAISGGAAIAAAFEQAALPPGVLQVLPGGADVGEALVAAPAVRVIAFTGSTQVGRLIGESAGRHLKRAHLELGGKNALLILPDVDVRRAATVGAWGAFLHQGQVCMSTGRHLVHESIAEQYTALLAEKAEKLRVGDPAREVVQLGPLIDATQRDRVHRLVRSSVDAGARLVAGGTYDGLFYRPTVLADVSVDAPAFREEIFGPVAPVTTYSSLDDAIVLANDTEYGLSLGILTNEVYRAVELAQRIPTGVVHINDQTIADDPVAPFGGIGASGTGARHGGHQANLEAFTETQWVTIRGELPNYPF